MLAKNVFIDYSGDVYIGNDIQITNGVVILTHDHKHHSSIGNKPDYKDNDQASYIRIEDNVVIGSNAVIMPTCHYIGKNARVGAGAVVTKYVPDYSVVVGVPQKLLRC